MSWSGSDPGSGIASWDVFVSEDGGPFRLWQNDAVETSATFFGEWGKTLRLLEHGARPGRQRRGGSARRPMRATVADCGPYDLAVTRIVAPKVVTLTRRKPAPSQARQGQDPEPQRDAPRRSRASRCCATLVDLEVVSARRAAPIRRQFCSPAIRRRSGPITLGSKKKLNVAYAVTFGCAGDPAKSTGARSRTRGLRAPRRDRPVGARRSGRLSRSTTRVHAPSAPPGIVVPYPDGSIKDKGCGRRSPTRPSAPPCSSTSWTSASGVPSEHRHPDLHAAHAS